MIRYARAGGDKPPLDRLPQDPQSARRATLASLNSTKAETAQVAEHMVSIRLMLADGPMSLPEITIALKTTKDKAKWAIRKLRLADEIQSVEGRRWALAQQKAQTA